MGVPLVISHFLFLKQSSNVSSSSAVKYFVQNFFDQLLKEWEIVTNFSFRVNGLLVY